MHTKLKKPQSGLTLIEVIVSVAILVVIAALVAPSMGTILKKNQVTSYAKKFQDNIREASYESKIRPNNYVVFCALKLSDKTACVTDNDLKSFRNGWQWFIESDLPTDPSFNTFTSGDTLLGNNFDVHTNEIGILASEQLLNSRIIFVNREPTVIASNSSPIPPSFNFAFSDEWDTISGTDFSKLSFSETGQTSIENLPH